MTATAFPLVMERYGITRCGFDFILGLGAILIMDQCSVGASVLHILIGGGRGNDHEACSINQTTLC